MCLMEPISTSSETQTGTAGLAGWIVKSETQELNHIRLLEGAELLIRRDNKANLGMISHISP